MKKKTVKRKKINKIKILFFIILVIIVYIIMKPRIFQKDNRINKCIVIDAGHGGEEEPGCIFGNVYEKDICLQIAKKVEAKLVKEYKKVIMTRTKDVNVTLKERPQIANNQKADIFVSIHQNALENDDITSGIETWYHPTKDTQSKILAQIIQENVTSTTGAKSLGIKESKELAVTKNTKMPSCLVETGFLSSTAERKKLVTSSYQEKIVEGICNGIKAYFELVSTEKEE